jgi:cytochrome P450
LISDNSLSFYRDPVAFVRKQIGKHGPLFQARLLNTATVFITEYLTAKDALSLPEHELSAAVAYQPFMSSVYGDNTIIMAQGPKHTSLSKRMMAAMTPELFTQCREQVEKVVHQSLAI